MATVFKYVNNHAFPLVLPGKRGVSVLFNPGQGDFDLWWSRFVGRNGLMRMAVSTKDGVEAILPERAVSAVPKPRSLLDLATASIEEETDGYIKRRGIYICKMCDSFRTGSRQAWNVHVREFHQIREEDEASGQALPPPPPRVVPKTDSIPKELVIQPRATKAEPAPQPAIQRRPVRDEEKLVLSTRPGMVETPKQTEEETVTIETTPGIATAASPQPENPPSTVMAGFQCPAIGCGRVFKSRSGLMVHMRAKHKRAE